MMLSAVGTVVFMPVAVPLIVAGRTASAWAVAKPLVFLVRAHSVSSLRLDSATRAADSRFSRTILGCGAAIRRNAIAGPSISNIRLERTGFVA
jgi:hypothetical protein